MNDDVARVRSSEEFVAAAGAQTARVIEIVGAIDTGAEMRLRPGQKLRGSDAAASLRFTSGAGGICLTRDNTVETWR